MSARDLSPIFQPEVRSTTSILHDEPWQGRAGLPSPGVLLVATIFTIGLAVLYALAFVINAPPLPRAGTTVIAVLALLGAATVTLTSKLIVSVRLVDVVASLASTGITLVLARDMGMSVLVAAGLVAIVLGVMALPGPPSTRCRRAPDTRVCSSACSHPRCC